MSSPVLSIITINYNNAAGLRKTVESVINQTFSGFEYIVVDGGSKDGSKEIIEQYEDKITYWVSEPDKGIYNAMNKGIRVASGEYLLFLNSGDYFYNNVVLHKASGYGFTEDIVYFDSIFIYKDESKSVAQYPEKLSLYNFLFVSSLCHQATFIKKELFLLYGLYDESLKIVSDWKFFLVMIFKKDCSYKHINEILVYYDNDGLSGKDWESNNSLQKSERITVLDKEFPGLFDNFNRLEEKVKSFENFFIVKALRKLGLVKKLT